MAKDGLTKSRLAKRQIGDPLAPSAAPASGDAGVPADGRGLAGAAEVGPRMVPIDRVLPDPGNLRSDLGDLSELADTIRARGILQPLLVAPGEVEGTYRIVMGHRRHAAAKLAGLDAVPINLQTGPDDRADRVEAMLIENLQRADLSPLDEGRAFQELIEAGWSQRRIAGRVGRGQAQISRRVALLRLSPQGQALLDSGGITVEDALALVRLEEHDRQDNVLQQLSTNRDRGLTNVSVDWLVTSEQKVAEREQRRSDARAGLQRDGVRILDDAEIDAAEPIGPDYGMLDIDPAAHAGEPCHAAIVDHDGSVQLVCTDPSRHALEPEPPAGDASPLPPAPLRVAADEADQDGGRDDGAGDPQPGEPVADPVQPPPQAEHDPAEDADSSRRERARRARIRRASFAADLVARKPSRTRDVDFALRQMVSAVVADLGEDELCQLLGIDPAAPSDPPAVEVYADAGGDALLRAALAAALSYGERLITSHDEPATHEVRRHYAYLQQQGYDPAPIEAEALDGETDAAAPAS